jgi:hypothetical protein
MERKMLSVIAMLAFTCHSTASQAGINSLFCDAAFVDSKTHQSFETGTINCSAGDLVKIDAELTQIDDLRNLKFSRWGGTLNPLTCMGGSQPFTVLNSLGIGTIHPGFATLVFTATDLTSGSTNKCELSVEVREAPLK